MFGGKSFNPFRRKFLNLRRLTAAQQRGATGIVIALFSVVVLLSPASGLYFLRLLLGGCRGLGSKFYRGDYRMNRETTLVEEVKKDCVEKIDASALRSSARNIPQSHAAQKSNLGDRIKGLFANVAKALEGDHGTQHYRS